ncbi:MAG: type II toxin-antitoxin system RelE/ParE family toxin [Candidatus Paceibacterota bacterium]
MYDYRFTENALRQITKLPKDIQKRIIKKLDYYCKQDNPLYYADFLTDYRIGQFRFRVGEYRVVFDVYNENIVILVVGHRKEIYKKK